MTRTNVKKLFFTKFMMPTHLLLVFLLPFLSFLRLEAAEKQIKTLVLIICSDEGDGYKEFQNSWCSYMFSDPEHFECYFIRGDENLGHDSLISGNTIWSKTQENYIPGILNKTIMSLEAMASRLDEFDYILRANLSSFFVFPRLLNFLETLPREKVYCGIRHHFHPHKYAWVNGSGIILSTDLAKMLITHRNEFINSNTIDDVAIGQFFGEKKIKITPSKAIELHFIQTWNSIKNHIPQHIFHFRVKIWNDPFRLSDLQIHQTLLDYFYSHASSSHFEEKEK